MDGALLLRTLREVLGEPSGSTWLDDFTSYMYLNQAACEFVHRTECLRTTQDITTVASQSAYNLNADFLQLYMRDPNNDLFVKFYDGTNYSWCYWKTYEEVFLANNTTSVAIPTSFTITDNSTLPTVVQGSATTESDKNADWGYAYIIDAAATFTTTEAVQPGDTVHNTTDGSMGVLASITNATTVLCAMFGGTDNGFDIGDVYLIQPQARVSLVLDPPPSTSGYTITVPYVQRPAPVYYGSATWRIPSDAHMAIVKYAAFLYKYRDREPQYGDAFYQHFENEVRRWGARVNEGIRAKGRLKVNLKVRGR